MGRVVCLSIGTMTLVLSLSALARGGDRPAGARVPWTASRVVGTPDPPPPYATEPAFPALRFEHPVVLASARGSERLFVGEQGGKIFSFLNDPACRKADLALDLAAHRPGLVALYGLAFHPKCAENRFVYLCYVTGDNTPDGTRVSRFTLGRSDPPRIDPSSEVVVLTFPSGGHNGGCLAFGPDGDLYVSTGDAEVPSPPDPRDTGQDVSDLLSSILRIDVDRHDPGRAYRVPPDNPFVRLPGARPEIWAYGFRNPWRMSFDRKSGDLWVGDVGWELWELVYRVEKGGNYGWSIVEGPQPVHPEGRRGPTPILPPTAVHPHSEAASITGGYVYRGRRLPDLEGFYVYGDFQSGRIWGLRYEGGKVVARRHLADSPLQLVSFGEDNAGELYLLDYERTRQVHRLVPNPASAAANRAFPRKLSETGLFTSTRDQTPAPGVVPYAINAPLWSDGASAERWLALPGTSRVEEAGETGVWRLPDGAVLARTVSVERGPGGASGRRRVETQVLHREGGSWRPYSYLWDDAQADATLAGADGATVTLDVADPAAPGGRRSRAYRVHARAECTLCHNPWVEQKTTVFGRQSASPLALTTGQLNREVPRDGQAVNQLDEFERLGLLARPVGGGSHPAWRPRTADPYDASADLERRARAYLQVNCAHCHQFGAGGAATIILSEDVPLDRMQAVGVKPSQGAFGISDARIIRPGDPAGSVLLYRVAKLGGGRMPRVGSSAVDERAVRMLGDWIERMPHPPGAPEDLAALKTVESAATSPSSRAEAINRLLSTTRGALALMRRIDRGTVPAEAQRQAVARGSGHAAAEVRDLFERYIPESQRVARLGETFDPDAILSLKGDARRGREVFLTSAAAQCKTCHRLDGVGEPLGPDLSRVGAKYPRPEMLRQILEPSRSIEPQYATYVVETKSGQVHTGLLASRTAAEVVLKDAQGKATRIPTDQVEQMIPQSRSLMPELLLRDLTAQQAADLLEYLGSLR